MNSSVDAGKVWKRAAKLRHPDPAHKLHWMETQRQKSVSVEQ